MSILVENISKSFGSFQALDRVNLEIKNGSLVGLLGPSGSGKSTLLRVLAGLDKPDSGRIWLEGQDATQMKLQEREIGFVFQNYALFPQLTVSENIAFGLDVKKINPILKKKRIQELLTLMQLDKFGDSYPSQLSGGQRQRVALARALAVEPKVLLLDEPFAALDTKIRKQLRSWLRELHHQISVTTVFVTHDHSEAMELAQEIVILENGKISQIGSAQELSDHPTNMFVRTFLELEKTPSIE
uniref:Sulfate transport system permease protein n=1 Tax=Micractinium conductrix TaxID=554055 RepID=A0A2I4S7G5_9CHLO|nr:sulfate transport system permease protein [Micractinium conductrix]AST08991.1 sulfate transport system permease protein [Micractinium conductrix]